MTWTPLNSLSGRSQIKHGIILRDAELACVAHMPIKRSFGRCGLWRASPAPRCRCELSTSLLASAATVSDIYERGLSNYIIDDTFGSRVSPGYSRGLRYRYRGIRAPVMVVENATATVNHDIQRIQLCTGSVGGFHVFPVMTVALVFYLPVRLYPCIAIPSRLPQLRVERPFHNSDLAMRHKRLWRPSCHSVHFFRDTSS